MLILLSPAKRINQNPISTKIKSSPIFLKETKSLHRVLKRKKIRDLQVMMKVSDKIAKLNYDRYKKMSFPFSPDDSNSALFTFQGDAYLGLEPETFDSEEIKFCQYHLRILSGFYGLLRPLDSIMPYRLEMGNKLIVGKHKNLYEFWGNKITNQINDELNKIESKTIINLASKEYYKAVKEDKLNGDVITINFKEYRNNEYKFMSAYGKKARGLMTKYIIKNKLTTSEELKAFDLEGYCFNHTESTQNVWLFSRSS